MSHSVYTKKSNNVPFYISSNSNHLLNIIKASPDSISKIMSNISFDKTTFVNATTLYNDELSAGGYKGNLTYQKELPPSNRVKRRKITWFNLPYIEETNIGKTSLKLTDKHFPKTNKLHKIFNGNNVRVSNSCLPSFASMIKSLNNRTLSKETAQGQPKCNCRQKDTSPLEGICLHKELTYQCYLKQNATSGEVNCNSLAENTSKD